MKILMISTDRKIFEDKSDVMARMVEYGRSFDELHIIIFDKKKNRSKISENVFVYSTASRSRLFYIYNAIKLGKRIIRNSKFIIQDSVITCQDPFETGIVGWRIARKFKIKLQLQAHTDFLNKHFIRQSVFNRVRVLIAKFLLPKADCIRVVSKKIADSLSTIITNSKIFVLPIFVDIEKIKNAIVIIDLHKKYPQFKKTILMASRLEKEKNISLAISAFKDVIKKYPKVGLIIVGDGSERKALELKVKSEKLKENIIFEGWKNKEIIYSYYKTADLFLVTSDYEGYGMTIIEALASGLPVLSTDVGIAREAGAEITERDSMPINIVKCMETCKKPAELKNYPYKNKTEYLEKFKQSFICVS